MSKIEAGQFSMDREEIDLCPLIRETVRVISLQAAQKSITVETRIAESMRLFADRRAIKQIAINLLSNAVKFTGEGGHISVRARNVSGALMLTIEDNGCGIPKEALGKLGRPFEQVQNQFSKNHAGSGLGLAISRSLAELHGGALKIRSTEGVGTIVSVRIPVKQGGREGAQGCSLQCRPGCLPEGGSVSRRMLRTTFDVRETLTFVLHAIVAAVAPAAMAALAAVRHLFLDDLAVVVAVEQREHLLLARLVSRPWSARRRRRCRTARRCAWPCARRASSRSRVGDLGDRHLAVLVGVGRSACRAFIAAANSSKVTSPS